MFREITLSNGSKEVINLNYASRLYDKYSVPVLIVDGKMISLQGTYEEAKAMLL